MRALLAMALAATALIAVDLLGGRVVAGSALAVTSSDEKLADPALEQRARTIGRELRCLVCQNQSIDDSDADLARDLRRIVRERVLAGDDDAQVLAWVEARYGEFVLLRPPVRPATWLLWFGPPAVLVAGAAGIALLRRRRGATSPEPAELDAAEQARLRELLGDPRP